MGIVILVIIFGSPIAYYFYSKHKKTMKEIERISGLDNERKKIELMKLQIQLDKKKTNHVLHFFITLFTLGFWVIIWIIIAHSNSSERAQIEKLINSI